MLVDDVGVDAHRVTLAPTRRPLQVVSVGMVRSISAVSSEIMCIGRGLALDLEIEQRWDDAGEIRGMARDVKASFEGMW